MSGLMLKQNNFIYDGLGREDNRLAVESVAFRLHMKAMVMLSSLTA